MAQADWEWTIHFQEKSPGSVRAKIEELRRQAPFDKLIADNSVHMPHDALLTGRGRETHALLIAELKDLVYGWHVESGPPSA